MAYRSCVMAAIAAATLTICGCTGDGTANGAVATAESKTTQVTVTSAGQPYRFVVENARTRAEQDRGLMYRTDIPENGGMLFYPYPAEGNGPREASFWMKNTPSPLDIIFIRENGTIARIAENTVPFSQDNIVSGEPVGAVLELRGGKTAELGISPGDTVTWPGGPGTN